MAFIILRASRGLKKHNIKPFKRFSAIKLMALGQRGDEGIIPPIDEMKLVKMYIATAGNATGVSPEDFLLLLREEFYLRGSFNIQNRFSNYIRRETHYEIERRGYQGEMQRWEVQGMTPHLYEMIRDEVLGRFVVNCNLILRERARRKEDSLSFLCDLALEKIAKRVREDLEKERRV